MEAMDEHKIRTLIDKELRTLFDKELRTLFKDMGDDLGDLITKSRKKEVDRLTTEVHNLRERMDRRGLCARIRHFLFGSN
jgi:hypothetical protein